MIRDAHGNGLLEVLKVSEEGLHRLQPLTHAVVIARQDGRTLLVFNRKKQHWELPGGGIDAGETPRECAVRELWEESGLTCDDAALRFFGGMAIVVASTGGRDARLEYGGIFLLESDQEAPFTPNEEISAVLWWDGREALANLCPIDNALASFAARTVLPSAPCD